METQQWFYEQNGAQEGPVSDSAIQAMQAAGTINGQTLVWREGLQDWVPLANSELSTGASYPPANHSFFPRQARLKSDFNFGIFDVIGKSWKVMVSNFWPFVGFYALVQVIIGFASNLVFPVFFMLFPMMGGYMYYTLKRVRGQNGDLENLFDGFKRRFGSLVAISTLMWIPIFVVLLPFIGFFIYITSNEAWAEANPGMVIGGLSGGLLLLGLVSSIFGTIATLAALLCLDCDASWNNALGLATKAYMKHFFKMTIFSIIAYFLLNIGVLFLVVGMFISGAWMVTAFSVLYEEAFGDQQAGE